jgi:carbamoyl-phosphate synthase large subunit
MKTVLVTGVGGGVGQGILRNLRSEQFAIRLVGTNTAAVSAGNHLCDAFQVVPYAYDAGYLEAISAIVERENVDLVIPSTDHECYSLMVDPSRVGATVAASPASTVAMCLDKHETARNLAAHGLPFARSSLPSAYEGGFGRTVVKPRQGRGSRDIHVDPADPRAFSDDYVVQEYLEGEELTTCFYVRRDGKMHGLITFSRDLEHGNTSRCEVVKRHDVEIARMADALISRFPFRGSCNLQMRVTARGIVPFEINCRISGTNSIRSQFGFRDVAYTVQEYLYDRTPDVPVVGDGCAIRMMVDVIYPDIGLQEISDRTDNFRIF